MTNTTTTPAATWNIEVGRTNVPFELQWDTDWTDEGPVRSEWMGLPWGAEVRRISKTEGRATTYTEATAMVRLIATFAPADAIIRFGTYEDGGMNLHATGWMTRDDALEAIDR